MYGTIGFEYAAMNIPVINASLNNPHIAYDFNINPKTRENYQKILNDTIKNTPAITAYAPHVKGQAFTYSKNKSLPLKVIGINLNLDRLKLFLYIMTKIECTIMGHLS